MAETIPGGAFLRGDTWVNADGAPLDKAQIAEAEKIAQSTQAQREQTEQARLLIESRNNPTANAVAQAIEASRQSAAPSRKARDEA